MVRNWTEYTDIAPPEVGADQERARLDEVMDEAVKPDGCPGTTIAELPALIDAKTAVPTE